MLIVLCANISCPLCYPPDQHGYDRLGVHGRGHHGREVHHAQADKQGKKDSHPLTIFEDFFQSLLSGKLLILYIVLFSVSYNFVKFFELTIDIEVRPNIISFHPILFLYD